MSPVDELVVWIRSDPDTGFVSERSVDDFRQDWYRAELVDFG